jgi:cellulose biosynthesis protein BcsQ
MRAICIASGKGGTSKSTLTAALGAWLARGHEKQPADKRVKVAIADLNFDQATLTRWWGKRGRPLFPHLLEITDFANDMAALRKAKWDYCLIDTPPDEIDVIHTAILEADATLIPVRPSELDIAACRAVVDLCRRRRKPFAFILTQVENKPDFRKINNAAIEALRATGGRVLEATFPMNKAYLAPITDHTLQGKTGHEIDPKLEANIAAIWKEVERIGDPVEDLSDLVAPAPAPAKRGRK